MDKFRKLAKLFLDSYNKSNYTVLNIGEAELTLGRTFLNSFKNKLQLLSTNILDSASGISVFDSFLLVEKKGYRFLILGVSPKEIRPSLKEITSKENIVIADPAVSLIKVINTQKDKYDFVLLLSSLNGPENQKLIEKVPDLDFIITAKDYSVSHLKNLTTKTLIIENAPQGKTFSKIELEIKKKGLTFLDISKLERIKKGIKRIDDEMIRIRSLSLDNGSKREQLTKLADSKDVYIKELGELNKKLKREDHNILRVEDIPLEPAIKDDPEVRKILDAYYKK